MKRILVAALAVAVFAGDVSACPGILGRLRSRVQARFGGGGCFGGGGQQFQQGGGQDFQGQGDQTQPNDDTVRMGYVGSGYPLNYPIYPQVGTVGGVNCPCVGMAALPPVPAPVQMAAPPAPQVPAAAPPAARPVAGEPPAVTPKAAVADDVLSPPGVGIAAVEKRTTALEAEVAALKQQVAALVAQLQVRTGVQQRSTVYMSGSSPLPVAAPVQYQTIPVQNVPVYYSPPVRYAPLGGTVCGPNGCVRQ